MKVTIKDCLALNVFKNAKVLAGENGLANDIRAISVLDACEKEDIALLEGNKYEIILTSFLGAKNDVSKQCEFVRELAAKGSAALAIFHVGRGVTKVSEALIEAAGEVGLPLIQMPPEAGYAEAISEVMDSVLYGDKFSNALISNTVFHLLNFEKHSNFQSALKEAAINNEFQLVLLSEDFNPIFAIETRHKISIADAIRSGREKHVSEETNKIYTLIDVEGALTYWGLVTIGNEKYYMLIVDNEDSYTAGEITKLAEIIELAMGMWKYTPERDAKSEFIKALIRGNKSLAYTLQDEARIDGADIVSVFFTKGIDREIEGKYFAEFEKKTDLEVMSISEDDETYGMVLKTADAGEGIDYQTECAKLFDKFKGNKAVRVFHVTGLSGIEWAGDAYKLIGESWTFVQSVFPYKRVFSKYELTLVNNCINIQIQGGFVKKNYVDLLEPFKAAGENKGKQLLDTLETFVLDAGMNSSKTAEFMDIHANTVQYRLKKINEMLGVEITGNRIIPGLTMALALKRLGRAVS